MDFDSYTSPEAEELLRSAASRYRRGSLDRRILFTEAAFAVAFLAIAIPIALMAPAGRSVSAVSLVITVGAYVVATQVEFPVAAGWTRPTQVVFVPMLFLLPLGLVPFAVVGCNILELAFKRDRGRVTVTRVLTRFGDAAFALGPALVLAISGEHRFGWDHWPLYVAAFAAQVAFDLASGLGRTWMAERILPSHQRQALWIFVTDGCLSCTGLLIAAATVRRPGLILLALPLIALLGLFARERQARMEHTLALSTAYRGTALLLGDVIEDDDEYTGIHSRAVVDLSLAVAERLHLNPTARQRVEFGALLHDVGKIRIPKEIINKPAKLDAAEWAIMKQHTVYGEQMLKQVGGVLSSVGKVVRASHERYDGTGYPDGLAGEAIPIEARVVSACDAFNAMTTNRPYRPAMSLADAVAELKRCAGSHFDPRVVYTLLQEVRDRPPVVMSPAPIAPARATAAAEAAAATAV